eukprot:g4454.t1
MASDDGLWPGRSEFQELCPGLLITNFFGARSKAKLAAAGVTHVLVCAQELPKVFEGNAALGLTYLRLPLADNPSERIADHFGAAFDFIDGCRLPAKDEEDEEDDEKSPGRCLVHCAGDPPHRGA